VNQPKPVRTLWQRLRPFIRRDLKGRLISASIAALVIAGLSWFGISAFTRLDSADAHLMRVKLGLENQHQVCSSRGPNCSYDDRVQARVDEQWSRDVRIRSAIYHELDLRIDAALANLDEAKQLLDHNEVDLSRGTDARLTELLVLPDLAPLPAETLYANNQAIDNLAALASYEPWRDDSPAAHAELLGAGIDAARRRLLVQRRILERQRNREPALDVMSSVFNRRATITELQVNPERYELQALAQGWIQQGVAETLSRSAFNLANAHPEEFAEALGASAEIWNDGWDQAIWRAQHKPMIRYRSPITDATRYRLAGVVFLAIACFVFVVVGPIVTATATAREREAGTLPVLRMTGMSANELALAMVVGPNVFAITLGGALLLGGVVLLAMTVPISSLALPLFLLAALSVATHLTAIGLGDALGQRVNAMVVGGLLGVGVLVPGLLGGLLASFDVAATGLLLGPLPPLTASVADLSGINHIGLVLGNDLTATMLVYTLLAQGLLGFVCLNSWRRRLEQGWAPLFRPIEGVLLALTSIGCSVLTLLDINSHHQAQDFDALNLLTFLSSAFLLPLLAWLLVASLRRPARARAVADHLEARHAFLRFQGFVAISVALVGATYFFVMRQAGLASADSEIMWATLAQLLLAAETGVATLLWASRRREGKLRVAFGGGAVVLLQLGAVFGTYGLEVEHVALTNSAAAPLLLNAEVSGYWLVFLVLCWAAGLALIFTALLRRRDEQRAAASNESDGDGEGEDDDDFGMPGRRLIH
jgi:hypothetical protein